jgi:hypothetical protein
MKNKKFSLSLVLVLLIICAGCSKGAMEVVPLKVKVEISRDISWGKDPTVIIGAENAYIANKELIIEGLFSFGAYQNGESHQDWIGKMFIRNDKLVIPIEERIRVKITS